MNSLLLAIICFALFIVAYHTYGKYLGQKIFRLNPDARVPSSEMRDDIELKPISAAVVDPHTGRPSRATIAFTLSYEGRNPETVRKVADVLTSLYLEENLQVRVRQTTETAEFTEETS